MNNSEKYSIRILDLKNGSHQFKFSISDDFFDDFKGSEIKKAEIKIELTLEKNERAVRIETQLTGTINTICDRCSDKFDCPVELNEILIAEFGNANSDLSDADEKIIIARDAVILNLKKHFFDYINMSLPVRRVHNEDQNGNSLCNKEMLDRLENINKIPEASKISDPRWDELKKLLN